MKQKEMDTTAREEKFWHPRGDMYVECVCLIGGFSRAFFAFRWGVAMKNIAQDLTRLVRRHLWANYFLILDDYCARNNFLFFAQSLETYYILVLIYNAVERRILFSMSSSALSEKCRKKYQIQVDMTTKLKRSLWQKFSLTGER